MDSSPDSLPNGARAIREKGSASPAMSEPSMKAIGLEREFNDAKHAFVWKVRRRSAAAARRKVGERILDIGCGTAI